MSKRFKWALLAMLGFATACSTVKNSAKQSAKDSDSQPSKGTPEAVNPPTEEHRIRLLYGVRRPEGQQVYPGPSTDSLPEAPKREE